MPDWYNAFFAGMVAGVVIYHIVLTAHLKRASKKKKPDLPPAKDAADAWLEGYETHRRATTFAQLPDDPEMAEVISNRDALACYRLLESRKQQSRK